MCAKALAQRTAERARIAAESGYRQLYGSTLDAFVVVGTDGRIIERTHVFTSPLGNDDGSCRRRFAQNSFLTDGARSTI